MRGVLTLILAAGFGIGLLAVGTDGGRALTSEGARRLEVEQAPRRLPDIPLVDQAGQALRLADYRGSVVVVDFMYTRCPTICAWLGSTFERIAEDLPAGRLGRDVFLLSISFDPGSDGPQALARYGARYNADPSWWRQATVADPADLPALLDAFDIIALPDGAGGFQHNAAVHLIDRDGRLARITDYDEPEQAVAAARGLL